MGKIWIDPFKQYKSIGNVQVRLGNTAKSEVLHNHDGTPNIRYAGYSEKLPDHHLWRCDGHSEPPRNKAVSLVPFSRHRFSTESKAGRGGCSMRECPGDAVQMNEDGTLAYCETCTSRSLGVVPCPWTTVMPCREPCSVCDGPEEEE